MAQPKTDLTYRAAPVVVDDTGPSTWDDESRSVEVIGTTENPAMVYDWERGIVNEVLLMSGLEMPKSRQVPLLNVHSRYDTSSVLGSYRDMKTENGQLIGRAFFSTAGSVDETALKVKEGHITDFSAGYRAIESIFVPEGQKQSIKGREFEGPMLVTTRWRIKELSVVPIGADEFATARKEAVSPEPVVETPAATETKNRESEAITMPDEITIDVKKEREDAQKIERERTADILAVASRHGFQTEAETYIREGKSAREFQAFVLNSIADKGRRKAVPGDAEVGLTDKEVKRFSFLNIVRALINPSPANQAAASFERECSEAAEKVSGRVARGFIIPDDVTHRGQIITPMTTRAAMNAASGPAGGYFVQTQYGSMIDMLYANMVVASLGAVQLRNLIGDFEMPKQTTGGSGYWVGEAGDATESAQALGAVTMRPKTVATYRDFTRRLEQQSSVDVESFLRMDIMRALALEIDATTFNGAGTPAEPMGIINTTGVGSVTFNAQNAPDFGDTIDMITAVAVDNALAGNLAYVFNSTIIGALMQTVKASSSDSKMIMETRTELNGYRVAETQQMPSLYGMFGNWADVLIGYWGGMDVNLDTATLSKSGGKRIVIMQDCDIAVRHAESFAVGYHV